MTALSSRNLGAAQAYNRAHDGVLWRRDALAWPLCGADPASPEFALLVAQFQIDHGLRVDGMLGPNTLSTMRAVATTEDDTQDALERNPAGAPDARECSHRVVVDGASIDIPPETVAAGLRVSNHVDDGEHAFEPYPRRESPRHFVIHESVTRTAAGVVRVLEGKKARSARNGRNGGRGYRYGVHFVLAPDGHVSQHADLRTTWLVHANQLNRSSIGCEIVNPYSARRLLPPFTATIPRRWWTWVPRGAPALYTLPTDAQLRSLRALISFVTSVLPEIPLVFPTATLNHRRTRIDGWRDGAMPGHGIVAHRDFSSHADGRYPLEKMIANLSDPQGR